MAKYFIPNSNGIVGNVYWGESLAVVACDFPGLNTYSNPSTLLIHANEESKLWHEIFVHLNYKYISDLSENDMVIGLPKIKFSKGVCQGCILGKHPDHKYERASHERTSAPIELINSDNSGPFPHMSIIQAKYALTFIDEFSRYCWVHFLKRKS